MIAKLNTDKDIYECQHLYCSAADEIPTWSGNCYKCPAEYTPAFKIDPYNTEGEFMMVNPDDPEGPQVPALMITNPDDPDGPKVPEKDYWCTEIATPEQPAPEEPAGDDGGSWEYETVVVRKRRYIPNDGPAGPTQVTEASSTSGTMTGADLTAEEKANYEA